MEGPPSVSPESISDMCFVQALFVHRCMRYGEARRIAAEIYGTDDHDVFKAALERVANRLDVLKMSIKKLMHFNDKQAYLAIVNRVEDKSAKISSKYNFSQLQFFNHIVEMIAGQEGETPGVCAVHINDALNVDVSQGTQMSQVPEALVEAGQAPKLSMQEKEDTLRQLKEDMWLGGDENEIFIGARTFMELKNHLLNLDLPEETHKAWSAAL